ncbi:MAG: LacI family DNA-binding transcriptional regulator [Bacteroidota bacterium]
MKDLARELKTTPSTISRAMKDHPRISASMKRKVLALAKKHNYKVNSFAAGLRMGKSNTIGVIVPRINRDFFSNVISGIEEIAFDSDLNVLICQSHDIIEKEAEHVNTLISNSVGGILVSVGLETKTTEHFKKALDAGIPLIFFDRVAENIDTVKIINNDRDGAFKAVDHLVKQGYKRIAHFGGPSYINIYRERKAGYIEALEANNIPVDKSLIVENDLKLESGKIDMEKLMKSDNPPDALFSASDYSALGGLLYLKENGYKIPEDIGVVGYSNEQWTQLISPSMTTIDQHAKEMGRFSAKVFIEEITDANKSNISRTVRLEPELIIGESTNRIRKNF